MYSSFFSNNRQLSYFDIRGAAETSRILLTLAGEQFDDVRFKIDETTFKSTAFDTAKENGDLKANLNRAPVLVANDGTTIGQSRSIERYISKQFNLMGNSPEEEAVIDCIAEHCRDVKDAATRKGFSKFTRNKTEEEKAVARAEWFNDDLPTMLGKIEDYLKEIGSNSNGCSVGSSPSYADVVIWSLLRDCPSSDTKDMLKAVEDCQKLNSIADNIAAHPNVSSYIKKRPKTMF